AGDGAEGDRQMYGRRPIGRSGDRLGRLRAGGLQPHLAGCRWGRLTRSASVPSRPVYFVYPTAGSRAADRSFECQAVGSPRLVCGTISASCGRGSLSGALAVDAPTFAQVLVTIETIIGGGLMPV